MAILSVGEIALLLGDSYLTFEDFMFTPEGARLKYRWDRYENFDLSVGTIVRTELGNLVTANIVTQSDYNRLIAESDKRDASVRPRITPLSSRPTVTLYSVGSGKGYEIQAGYIKVRQDYAPAISGNYNMTTQQAQSLADFIADKMYAGLSPAVSVEQVTSVWNATKTNQELIDAEKLLMGI